MKTETIQIKKLEKLEDLDLLKEGDIIRTLKERYGVETPDIELRVYAGKTRDGGKIELLNITGPGPSPISSWIIDKKNSKIKQGMLYIPFFPKDVKTGLYTTKSQLSSYYYIKKREIIEKSGLLPDYNCEQIIDKPARTN